MKAGEAEKAEYVLKRFEVRLDDSFIAQSVTRQTDCRIWLGLHLEP